MESSYAFEAKIRLLTTDGKEVFYSTDYISQGDNRIKIEFGAIPQGNYIVVLEGESHRLTSQLTIINN